MAATLTAAVCSSAEVPYLERVRFFPRQLVAPTDLTQDQEYFRSKARRHNRLLHGWGVVAGAGLDKSTDKTELVIALGYILGPYGDEIVVDSPVNVPVCTEDVTGVAATCLGGMDPWCGDVRVDRNPDQPLYLAVKYVECQVRPVRAYQGACGCTESDCEYSRIRDGFAAKLLTSLPSSYDPMPDPTRDNTDCPDDAKDCGRPLVACPTDPWVILADVKLNADCTVKTIDCLPHRRFITSFGGFYFTCGNGA